MESNVMSRMRRERRIVETQFLRDECGRVVVGRERSGKKNASFARVTVRRCDFLRGNAAVVRHTASRRDDDKRGAYERWIGSSLDDSV